MKKAALVFEKSELVLDIKHRAYLMAKSASDKSENPDKEDSWLMDIANKEDLMREPAGRLINEAFLDAYTKVNVLAPDGGEGEYVESDKYAEIGTYMMNLVFRDNAKTHLIRALHDLIHEYIVYKVLLLWCELVSRGHTDVLLARLSMIDGQIKTAIKPIQAESGDRPLFPFG